MTLCLSLTPLYPIPCSILTVDDSHKYSADLMRGHHCNKLIQRKRMFHLGITHNKIE
jgi:hypothetical protein